MLINKFPLPSVYISYYLAEICAAAHLELWNTQPLFGPESLPLSGGHSPVRVTVRISAHVGAHWTTYPHDSCSMPTVMLCGCCAKVTPGRFFIQTPSIQRHTPLFEYDDMHPCLPTTACTLARRWGLGDRQYVEQASCRRRNRPRKGG